MSDLRDTPPTAGAGARPVSPTPRGDMRSRGDDQFEHERIGIHNEAQTVRRDRIRWGPVWAGKALLALELAAAAAGGALGAKIWPKDDAFVDLVRRKRTQ